MDRLSMVFESAALTHEGRVRAVNEDSFLLRPGSGLWAVSDGMGGHSAGRMASSVVVEELGRVNDAATASELLAECTRGMERAHQRLRAQAAAMNLDLIGATVVILLVHAGAYACIWSGDSRIYRIHGGEITQLTRDHSEAEDLVAEGVLTREESRHWPRRNVVTRAVGVTGEVELEIVDGRAEVGDIFVLCSDGLNCHVSDAEIQEAVTGQEPKAASDALLALALDRGGLDNVTVVVVRCDPREPTVLSPDRKLAPDWSQPA